MGILLNFQGLLPYMIHSIAKQGKAMFTNCPLHTWMLFLTGGYFSMQVGNFCTYGYFSNKTGFYSTQEGTFLQT